MTAPSSDDLLGWRAEFPILNTCTYLVSHSLGAMPKAAEQELLAYASEWQRRGVRAWHEGWWEIGRTTGDLLAPLLGVRPGTISMHQNVTTAQAVIASCHSYDGRRRKIVMSELEFPSNMYLFEGFRRYGAEPVYVGAPDGIRVPLERTLEAIDDTTLLVVASLVIFKSAHPECCGDHRTGTSSRGASGARRVPGDRSAPDAARRSRGGFRRWRLGQVALRRARSRLPVRAA
jgi:kynureninase